MKHSLDQINIEKKTMKLNYLFTPSNTIVDPPIETTAQELPLEKLSWEDFEKLCLVLVQINFSINDCEIYGIKGQAQEGIDIFARQANGKYSSFQCKRYQEFVLSDINKAVEYFKSKAFFDKSDNLYLCTSCEWNTTQVQDRFEVLKTELERDSITLIKWDKIQISRHLKKQPQIVFDFFGIEWVKKFNGEPALKQISKSKKIDAQQIIEFRTELHEFYSTIFNIQDPGIPIKELNSPYSLQDRFIIPDILSNVKGENFEVSKNNDSSTSSVTNLNQYDYFFDEDGYGQNEFKYRHLNKFSEVDENSVDVRIKIDDALVDNRNIIIGDPGAGKSTLLRYITLDILSPHPRLENISQKYGKALPVWLPFAFITKHLSQNDSLSISEILNLWFNGFGKNHLFEIAKQALEDERLFLVIDGIDEWSSISSAQQAITRIETIRELYDCKVLYSSRPYGFKILKDFFTNLNVLNLAGFSKLQQKDFVQKWYEKWASLQREIKDKSFSKTQTENFIKELEQAGDLKKLAEVPLLLSILIVQKLQDAVLPKSKLEALKEITQYLIKKHPVKRGSDAGVVQDHAVDIDFKDIFCELAIYIQKESNDGVILKGDAQKIVEQYLINYADYDKVKAKVRSQELIEVGANNFGIIIEKSNDEISFGHKQFQEFLAAQYLYESDEDNTNEFIKEYAANPSFHQVIISFFGLLQLKQVKKFQNHYDKLKESAYEKYQEDYLKLISYEIAINLDNAPGDLMNNSFDSIVCDFEYETDPTYKKALLRRILSAIHNGRLKEKVQKFLIQYFPNEYKYQDYRVTSLRYSDNLNELQLEFLKKALINGTLQIRYDASYAFKKHIKHIKVFAFLSDIILNCSNPNILAFAINSIVTAELSKKKRNDLIDSIKVIDPIVQLFIFKHKVLIKQHSQDDLSLVLPLVNHMPYQLKAEAIDLLTAGFEKNSQLKEILINSIKKKATHQEDRITIDTEIAWKVLFHCFNQDADVIGLVKSEFENEKFPFLSADRHEMFRHLVYYFKGAIELVPAVEKWLSNRMEEYSHIDPEVAFACVFTHSKTAKTILLNDLPKTGVSHWNVMALLEGWPNDVRIKDVLKKYFRSVNSKKTSAAAHYISKVFDSHEKEEAISILEGILFDKKITFRERAISAIIEIDREYFEKNILETLIEDLESFPKDFWGQYYSAVDTLVRYFPANSVLQSYILHAIGADNRLYSLSIRYFPELIKNEVVLLKKSIPLSKELRSMILESLTDLSVLTGDVEEVLGNFEAEAEEEIMSDMAMCLFNHIKDSNPDKILALCKPLVFARGLDYEVKRSIAFTGFLIVKKVDEYFSIENPENKNDQSRLLDIFDEYAYRRYASEMMIKSIIYNFDYLISFAGKDFSSIADHLKHKKNIEDIWGFFARHSVKSSPTYVHIMEFITANPTAIKNSSIISFLNRTTPKSPILKDILLELINNDGRNGVLAGRILGTNFKSDNQVYEEVKKIAHLGDSGKIIALCSGWPQEPILKEMFDDLVKNQYYIDNYVGYTLKFLFRDINNLVDFLKSVVSDANSIDYKHKYFFIPMIERLKRDKDFALAVKGLLLSSTSINEKISYYNLLSQLNMVDQEVTAWKNKICNFKDDFGYDIVSNKTVRLKDILHDYSFE